MGAQDIVEGEDAARSACFSEALMADLRTLEQMLDAGALECDVVRIGAEQEMFLVDRDHRPAPLAPVVLEQLGDAAFTTEIGKFNLEANLAPRLFEGACLRALETDLRDVVQRARAAARVHGADVVLAGILPSARLSDLTLDNLTDKARYRELNRTVMNLRGGSYELFVKGLDELQLTHDSVMLEACCASFQVHFQLDPRRFAAQYNAAQAAAGPVLAGAVNSPLLLGQRLWEETRIALFQHAVDERTHSHVARRHPTRVAFGEGWVEDSVLEIYREQVSRFRAIFTTSIPDAEEGGADGVPLLQALTLHNGSIWRWNRPCYGITESKPHLRLEFRCLPAGPTVLDEVANAAFIFGLLVAIPQEYGNVASSLSFDAAKENFFAAARHGLKAQLTWLDGKHRAVGELILEQLLPLAIEGLRKAGLNSEDIDRYLGVIRERIEADQTGASWILCAASSSSTCASTDARDRQIVAAMLAAQSSGDPVHRWTAVSEQEMQGVPNSYQTVTDIMSTDLFTVTPDDPIALAAGTMTWRHIRHLPVEDACGKFVGLLSSREILRVIAEQGLHQSSDAPVTVRGFMNSEPVTVSPNTPTVAALHLMLDQKLDCLPVLKDGELVGIVSSQDMLVVLGGLLHERADSATANGPAA
jgi:CBS domain-containing protein/gamma-glutamyl:cysteine ligase YbdK (ATP-grasp superfamily)